MLFRQADLVKLLDILSLASMLFNMNDFDDHVAYPLSENQSSVS